MNKHSCSFDSGETIVSTAGRPSGHRAGRGPSPGILRDILRPHTRRNSMFESSRVYGGCDSVHHRPDSRSGDDVDVSPTCGGSDSLGARETDAGSVARADPQRALFHRCRRGPRAGNAAVEPIGFLRRRAAMIRPRCDVNTLRDQIRGVSRPGRRPPAGGERPTARVRQACPRGQQSVNGLAAVPVGSHCNGWRRRRFARARRSARQIGVELLDARAGGDLTEFVYDQAALGLRCQGRRHLEPRRTTSRPVQIFRPEPPSICACSGKTRTSSCRRAWCGRTLPASMGSA